MYLVRLKNRPALMLKFCASVGIFGWFGEMSLWFNQLVLCRYRACRSDLLIVDRALDFFSSFPAKHECCYNPCQVQPCIIEKGQQLSRKTLLHTNMRADRIDGVAWPRRGLYTSPIIATLKKFNTASLLARTLIVTGVRGRHFDWRLLVQQNADPRRRLRHGKPHDWFTRHGPLRRSQGGLDGAAFVSRDHADRSCVVARRHTHARDKIDINPGVGSDVDFWAARTKAGVAYVI